MDPPADQGARELALLPPRAQEAQASQASSQEEHRVRLGYASSPRLEDGSTVRGGSPVGTRRRSRIQEGHDVRRQGQRLRGVCLGQGTPHIKERNSKGE